jgi:hypothetical protein
MEIRVGDVEMEGDLGDQSHGLLILLQFQFALPAHLTEHVFYRTRHSSTILHLRGKMKRLIFTFI